jgi:hypothetical protein
MKTTSLALASVALEGGKALRAASLVLRFRQ